MMLGQKAGFQCCIIPSQCPSGPCPSAHLFSFQGDSFPGAWNPHIAVTWQPGAGGCSHLPCSFHHPGPSPSSLAWALPGSEGPAGEAPSTCFPSQPITVLTGTTETLVDGGKSSESAEWTRGRIRQPSGPGGSSRLFSSMEDPGAQGWTEHRFGPKGTQPSARDRAYLILVIHRCS